MRLASLEPCANELILYTYIYIKSAFIIHIGQNAFVCSKKKSYVHSTKKLSQLFFTVCSNKQQRQEEKLKITFNDNRPKLHLRNTYVQELCTCLRGALCCLKSNYFSKECHQDYSLESLTSGLFYKTVKQGLRS